MIKITTSRAIKIIIFIKVFFIFMNLITDRLNNILGSAEITIVDANTISSLNNTFDKNNINIDIIRPIDENNIPNLYELSIILSYDF